MQRRATKSLTALLSRRGEAKSDSWRKNDYSGGKAKLRRTRREDERQARLARGEKRSRGAPVLLYISRPSSGRQIDSVGAPPSFSIAITEPSRARARAYHVASHLFTLTQYLLGRIGESAVRSFARPASLFRDCLPSFSPAMTTG